MHISRKTMTALMLTGAMALTGIGATAAFAGETEPAQVSEEADATTQEDVSLGDILSAYLEEKSDTLDKVVEDGGVIDDLFGEEGLLAEYVPEGLDVQEMASEFVKELEDGSSELYQYLEAIAQSVKESGEQLENLDPQALIGFIGTLLNNTNAQEDESLDLQSLIGIAGALFGDEDAAEGEGLGEYEALFLKEEQEAALAKYLEAYYAKEGLQDGTEHLLGVYVYDGQYLPDGSQQVLGYFTQMNFNVDGEALVEAGSAGDAMLITFTPNEDGSWEVTDFKVALEGEDYPEQVAGLAKAMGQTEEDFFGGIHDNGELSCLYEMDTYMTEHPEIKSVTFRNETFSKDELEKRISEDQSKIM